MKYKTFNDLKFHTDSHPFGSMSRAKLFFPNGYGVSVIIGSFSYGGDEGLYECAVLKGKEGDSKLCYDTPITNDVIGYCDEDKVTEIMKQIQDLKKWLVNKY